MLFLQVLQLRSFPRDLNKQTYDFFRSLRLAQAPFFLTKLRNRDIVFSLHFGFAVFIGMV